MLLSLIGDRFRCDCAGRSWVMAVTKTQKCVFRDESQLDYEEDDSDLPPQSILGCYLVLTLSFKVTHFLFFVKGYLVVLLLVYNVLHIRYFNYMC